MPESKNLNVKAVGETLTCHTLVDDENKPYQSTADVGTIDGTGKFVVGQTNRILTATANDNYQIVGWQVVYEEQENKTIFIDTKGLVDNSKTIELEAKDGRKVDGNTL